MSDLRPPIRPRAWVALAVAATLLGCDPPAGAARQVGEAEAAEASSAASVASAAPAATGSVAPPLPSASAPTASPSVSAPSATASASAAADAAPPPCPPDMVAIGRVCIDRFEAHLRVEVDGAEPRVHPHTARPEAGVRYVAANERGASPQGYISRVEAKAACEAAGKRLCTKGEWTRACKGKGWETWPYGQRGERGRCNTGKLHLLTIKFGKVPGGLKYEDHFNSPELNQEPGYLAPSGQYEGCASDRGVYDMVGNLHEWVSDTVDQELVDKLAEEDVERRDQPWREGNGVFMGGFYSTTSEHGPGCAFITIAHEPTYHDYSTGFRCCRAATLPASPTKTKRGR